MRSTVRVDTKDSTGPLIRKTFVEKSRLILLPSHRNWKFVHDKNLCAQVVPYYGQCFDEAVEENNKISFLPKGSFVSHPQEEFSINGPVLDRNTA